MEYYTYAYLREDGTPYYIGKGKGNRAYIRRQRRVKPPSNKNRIIILKQNLTEEEAFKHEIYMISVFGRKDLGTGILHNMTNGGDGTSGRVISEEEREKMRQREVGNKRNLGRKTSEETKLKISKANKGKKRSNEQKEKLKNRKTKPLIDNPSPHTLYMREWRKNNLKKCKESLLKYRRNKKMTEDFVRLNLDELDALKNALQLLSRKEQKLMESSGKVSLNALYNKLQSTVEHINRTQVQVAH